ncbi:MAG: serine/threonine-protein kinase [Phycisphaerales bacterium]
MSDGLIDHIRPHLSAGLEVEGPLGSAGGQGAVLKGKFNGAPAAIKVFRPETDHRRVDREIELLSNLACPRVVKLLHAETLEIEGESLRVLAYELHTGGDLTRHLANTAPPLTPVELVKIGHEVGIAVEELWKRKIVHRDIKPANIVEGNDGGCVLVDVGLARHVDRSNITLGGAPGTRGFRSPEQARGRKSLTIHSDAWSLGVTLFILAAKRHPFGNQDVVNPTTVNMTPLRARGDLDPLLIDTIQQMLSFVPSRRPSNLVERFATIGG